VIPLSSLLILNVMRKDPVLMTDEEGVDSTKLINGNTT
jgi:hypothetical protein